MYFKVISLQLLNLSIEHFVAINLIISLELKRSLIRKITLLYCLCFSHYMFKERFKHNCILSIVYYIIHFNAFKHEYKNLAFYVIVPI